jgi:hypothetical protein
MSENVFNGFNRKITCIPMLVRFYNCILQLGAAYVLSESHLDVG